MANLLITGGAGFIGSNFVRHWRQKHSDDGIVVLDCLTYAGDRGNLVGVSDVEFIVGDICDAPLVENLLRTRTIDTIVHFAAETHVDRSISGPDAFIVANVVGTHNLLKAARAVWLDRGSGKPHRFHHISTDEVYGSLEADDPAFHELTRYAPNSPYSASKAASDHLVRAYHHTFGMQTTISNCSNNYGPFQFPEKLVPLMMIHALLGRSLPIYGDGRNVRDWLHVEDHCRGIELILAKGEVGQTYNIGARTELTNRDVVGAICQIIDDEFAKRLDLRSRFPACPAARGAKTSSLIEFVRDRPGHDRRYAIDAGKIENELGFRARHSFTTGLLETFNWYVGNEGWWASRLLSGIQP